MTEVRRIPPSGLVALFALAAVLLGCSGGDDDAVADPDPSTSIVGGSGSEETSTVPAPPTDEDVLRQIAPTEEDVPGAAHVELIPGGDEVENQVTLDFCGADFPSEADRVARHQVAVRDQAGVRLVGHEGVVYRTEADAAQALEEVRAAVAGCDPEVFVESAVAGVPPLRFDLALVTDGMGDLTDDHVALNALVTAEDGASMELSAAYLRRGRVVVGLYGTPIDVLRDPAALATQRLEALPDAAVSD